MKVKLKHVRIIHLDLWNAKKYNEESKYARYGLEAHIEKGSENHKAIIAAIKASGAEKFGDKADAKLRAFMENPQKTFYHDGDKSDKDYRAGLMYVSAYRREDKGPPAIRDRDGITNLTIANGKPYSGCFANVFIDVYCQNNENAGIRCELLGVQFLEDGPAFGGGTVSDDDFDRLDNTGESGSTMDDDLLG